MQIQSAARAQKYENAVPSLLSENVESEVKLIGIARTFTKDQEIFGEGEAADFVYKVVTGAVRSFRILADGRRQIGDFYLPGDVFGMELGQQRRSAAEAVGDAVVIVARRATLTADPDNADRLWRHALRELQRSQDHVLTVGRRSATERVARFLLDLNERRGAGVMLELPMSRQDIADFLGLTIETVSRTLTQMQLDDLIEVSGCRHVRLTRRAALAELCE